MYNFIEGDFSVFDRDYELIDTNVRAYSLNVLPEVALQLLNAPYLWGGKSVLGIDCSGFVQTVFAVCGKMLPRDASQQVAEGETICFLTEAKSGDLAFFENEEGDIVHVGLLLDNRRIVHASGSVKISLMDNYGILSPDGGYSHKLRIIKRIKC